MSRRNPARFLAGLAVELTALIVGVSLLPKLPWGQSDQREFADQKPTLADTAQHVFVGKRPSIIPAAPPTTGPGPFPADPAYVERRLDQAGQQLLSGFSTYLNRTTREIFQSSPAEPLESPQFPQNALRY
jgi:hypothetical protein